MSGLSRRVAARARAHPMRAESLLQVLLDDLLTCARLTQDFRAALVVACFRGLEEVSPPPLSPTPIPPQVSMAGDLLHRHGRLLQLPDRGERLPFAPQPALPLLPSDRPGMPLLTGWCSWWRLPQRWVPSCRAAALCMHDVRRGCGGTRESGPLRPRSRVPRWSAAVYCASFWTCMSDGWRCSAVHDARARVW